MKTKHTPGPWKVDSGGDGELEVWAPKSGRATLATVGSGPDTSPEEQANARLIAAAPDLLANLEFLADQWEEEFDTDAPINGADFVQWFAECLPRMRAAIAKARGK